MIDRAIIGSTPLIIFIGPAYSGKSMILMSLVAYLSNKLKKYVVTPNYEYISNDDSYKKECDCFMKTLQKHIANKDFYKFGLYGSCRDILLDVRVGRNGPVKFRMLEAPGEDFFNLHNPNKPYAQYLNKIISKVRKENYPVYYVMLLNIEDCWNISDSVRRNYELRLIEFFDNGFVDSRGDKVVLLYNKIDMVSNKRETLDNLLSLCYPDIRDYFKRRSCVFFKVPVCNGVMPYKTGKWFEMANEGIKSVYYKSDAESEAYAERLWNTLTARL